MNVKIPHYRCLWAVCTFKSYVLNVALLSQRCDQFDVIFGCYLFLSSPPSQKALNSLLQSYHIQLHRLCTAQVVSSIL